MRKLFLDASLTPKLQRVRYDEPIPHIYNSGDLCLYLPRINEWTPSMSIAQTIVPWTYKWLYFYEFWQVTGTWSGGGEHPRYRSELKKYVSNQTANILREP